MTRNKEALLDGAAEQELVQSYKELLKKGEVVSPS
jgi:hypothetical protein